MYQKPSCETCQAIGFLHAYDILLGCPFEHVRWKLSIVFNLHFFPLKIAAVLHELIKPLAIKLSHFQDYGYQQHQHENISKSATLSKAVGWKELRV